MKRISKILKIFFLSILLLLVLGHFWFINHAERSIEQFIAWKSDGIINAQVKKISINYLNDKIVIRDLELYNTDSLQKATSYHLSVQNFTFKAKSVWDFIWYRKLEVELVHFDAPVFTLIRRANNKDTTAASVDLPKQIGDFYLIIKNTFTALKLQRLEINDSKLVIKYEDQKDKIPFEVSHIDFTLNKFNIDTSTVFGVGNLLASDMLLLRITNQHILLPEGNGSVSFKQLLLDSKNRLIAADSVTTEIDLAGKGKLQNYSEKLRISGLDFRALYMKQLIAADTLLLSKSSTSLAIELPAPGTQKKQKDNRVSVNAALSNLPFSLNIKNVLLQNSNLSSEVIQGEKSNSYSMANDNLTIRGLQLTDSLRYPLYMDEFEYTTRNNVGYTKDSIYKLKFGSISIKKDNITLNDFNLETYKPGIAPVIANCSSKSFEIKGLDLLQFVVYQKLRAESATLTEPVISLLVNDDADTLKRKKGPPNFKVMTALESLIDIDVLNIKRGTFNYKLDIDKYASVYGINSTIAVKEFNTNKVIVSLKQAVKELSFETANLVNNNFRAVISGASIEQEKHRLNLKSLRVNAVDSSLAATINGVNIDNVIFTPATLSIGAVGWDSGHILVNEKQQLALPLITKKNKDFDFTIHELLGANTFVNLESKKAKIQVLLTSVTTSEVNKHGNNDLAFKGLEVAGEKLRVKFANGDLSGENLLIKDKETSYINGVSFVSMNEKDTTKVAVKWLQFIPDIDTISRGVYVVKNLVAESPNIYISKASDTDNAITAKHENALPQLQINELRVNNVVVKYYDRGEEITKAFSLDKSQLNVDTVKSLPNKVSIVNARATLYNSRLKSGTEHDIESAGNTTFSVPIFTYNMKAKQTWNAVVESLVLDKIGYQNFVSNENLSVTDIKINNVLVTNSFMDSLSQFLSTNEDATVSLSNIKWQNANNNFSLKQLHGNAGYLHLDSLSMHPVNDRDIFYTKTKYRKDYITLDVPALNISGIKYLHDSILRAQSIESTNGLFSVYNYNLLPRRAPKAKLLPHVSSIVFPFIIDTIYLLNQSASYLEMNAVTKHEGEAVFTNTNAQITGFSNMQKQLDDSLKVTLTSTFIHEFPVRVKIAQAYSDSLNGFALQLHIQGGELPSLNKVLNPLAGFQVQRGIFDSMYLDVKANEYKASGTMSIKYKNLKVKTFTSYQKPTFKQRFLSALANTFAFHNKDLGKPGNIVFVRDPERSAVSYFLKILVQGAIVNAAPAADKSKKKK